MIISVVLILVLYLDMVKIQDKSVLLVDQAIPHVEYMQKGSMNLVQLKLNIDIMTSSVDRERCENAYIGAVKILDESSVFHRDEFEKLSHDLRLEVNRLWKLRNQLDEVRSTVHNSLHFMDMLMYLLVSDQPELFPEFDPVASDYIDLYTTSIYTRDLKAVHSKNIKMLSQRFGSQFDLETFLRDHRNEPRKLADKADRINRLLNQAMLQLEEHHSHFDAHDQRELYEFVTEHKKHLPEDTDYHYKNYGKHVKAAEEAEQKRAAEACAEAAAAIQAASTGDNNAQPESIVDNGAQDAVGSSSEANASNAAASDTQENLAPVDGAMSKVPASAEAMANAAAQSDIGSENSIFADEAAATGEAFVCPYLDTTPYSIRDQRNISLYTSQLKSIVAGGASSSKNANASSHNSGFESRPGKGKSSLDAISSGAERSHSRQAIMIGGAGVRIDSMSLKDVGLTKEEATVILEDRALGKQSFNELEGAKRIRAMKHHNMKILAYYKQEYQRFKPLWDIYLRLQESYVQDITAARMKVDALAEAFTVSGINELHKELIDITSLASETKPMMLVTVGFSVIGFWLVMILMRNLIIEPLQTIAHLLIRFRYTKRVDINSYEDFFKKNHLLEIREVIDVLPQIFDEYRAIKQNENQLKQRYEELVIHSKYDGLTKVFNRGSLNALVKEIDGATPSCFAIIMVDIDHFKKLNDSMGHQCGDEVLFAVAQTLHSNLAKKDLVFRYGGEEFCIILSDVNEPNALKIAQRLCQCVENLKLINKGIESGFVTISVGLSTVTTVPNQYRINDLIKHADKALYKAKSTGRNRACIYSDKDEDSTVSTHTNGLMSFVHAPTDAAKSYSHENFSSDDVEAALNGKHSDQPNSSAANASTTAAASAAVTPASASAAVDSAQHADAPSSNAANAQLATTGVASVGAAATESVALANEALASTQLMADVEEIAQEAAAQAKAEDAIHGAKLESSSKSELTGHKAVVAEVEEIAAEVEQANGMTTSRHKTLDDLRNAHKISLASDSAVEDKHDKAEHDADKYEHPMSAMTDYFASSSSLKKSNDERPSSDAQADVDDAKLVDAVLSIATGRSTSAMQQARAERSSSSKVYENNYVVAPSDEVSDYSQAFEMSMPNDEHDEDSRESASQTDAVAAQAANADAASIATTADAESKAANADATSKAATADVAFIAATTEAAAKAAAAAVQARTADSEQSDTLLQASLELDAEQIDESVDSLHMLSTEEMSKSIPQRRIDNLVKRAEDDSKSVYHSNLYAQGIDGTVAEVPEERISQMKSLLAEVSQIKEDAAHYAELRRNHKLDDAYSQEEDPSPVLNKPMGTDDLESYDEMVDSNMLSAASIDRELGHPSDSSNSTSSVFSSSRPLSSARSFAEQEDDVTISPVIEKDGFAELSIHSNKRGYSEMTVPVNLNSSNKED